MSTRISFSLLLLLVACSSPDASDTPEASAAREDSTVVTFAIDMRAASAEGWFVPAEDAVGLRGSITPLSWSTSAPAADPDADGIYTTTLTFPAVTFPVEYKVKVDGPGNPNDGWENGGNRTFASQGAQQEVARAYNEGIETPEATLTGDIRVHEAFTSTHLDRPRDLYVYLPPGYDDDASRRYPVLYLHDGNNMFDARGVGAEWEMDEAAESLIGAGAIEPVILVGVSNTADRIREYTPSERAWRFDMDRRGGPNPLGEGLNAYTGAYPLAEMPGMQIDVEVRNGSLYLRRPDGDAFEPLEQTGDDMFFLASQTITARFVRDDAGLVAGLVTTKPPEGGAGEAYGRLLVEEVIPFIESTYRVQTGREHTGLGGSSLGGLVTMYLGLQYPDTFGTLLVVSPSIWWDDRMILDEVEALEAPTGQRIWLDMGTGEGERAVTNARALRDLLVAEGWTLGDNLRYTEARDAPHNERAWATRTPDMLRFAFGPETVP